MTRKIIELFLIYEVIFAGMLMSVVQTSNGAKSSNCNRAERLVNGRCEPCPHCAPGHGLPEHCGHGLGEGVQCASCPDGSFNPPPGGSSCLTCTNCTSFHRLEAFRCRSVIDAECGQCMDGYFDDHLGVGFGAKFIFPCTPCTENPKHEQCMNRHTHPQVVAPVTIKLQASLHSDKVQEQSGPHKTMALLAVILGSTCVLTLSILAFFLIKHRRLLRRVQRGQVESTQSDPITDDGVLAQSTTSSDETSIWRRRPHLRSHIHGAECMTPARQASGWCPNLTIRPEFQADSNRKRKELASKRIVVEEEYGDDTEHLLAQKRPRYKHDSGSPRGACGPAATLTESPESARAHLIEDEPRMVVIVSNRLDKSNDAKYTEHRERLMLPSEYRKSEDGDESDDGEDARDGVRPVNENEGIERMDLGDDNSELDDEARLDRDVNGHYEDLQHLGACALPIQRGGNDNLLWPLPDDFGNLVLSAHSSPPRDGDLDMSFHLEFEGETRETCASRASSGNLSQASTVLIRGISESPTTIPADNMDMPSTAEDDYHPSEEQQDENLTVHLSPGSLASLQEPLMTARGAPGIARLQGVSSLPNPSIPLFDEMAHDPITRDSSYVSPAPRRLAALANNIFTGSRGDVALTAEEETETIPRTLETLDEERYAQALRLAGDHMVSELDFVVVERLAASLHPRNLVGDRNFRHLGSTLGVPSDVLQRVTSFDDLLAHLRRQRTTLVVFLRAIRALARMDVVFLLSVWVLESFSDCQPPGGSTRPVAEQPRSPARTAMLEMRGPLAIEDDVEEEDQRSTFPVQETGEY